MPRYFLQLVYNGTAYHGWQVQPNANSVQAEIEKALATLLRAEVPVVGCGRTDTGVHAEKYFLHIELEDEAPDWLVYKLNQILPEDIAFQKIVEVGPEDHARFSATSRSYRYDIHTEKDPFLKNKSAMLHYELDIDVMNRASALLLTEKDFACFCKAGSDVNTTLCDVTEARWVKDGHRLHFHISADRFLRNMVRAVVGTMIDVGRGKISVEEVKEILASKDRSAAGKSAAACGLYLTEVEYSIDDI